MVNLSLTLHCLSMVFQPVLEHFALLLISFHLNSRSFRRIWCFGVLLFNLSIMNLMFRVRVIVLVYNLLLFPLSNLINYLSIDYVIDYRLLDVHKLIWIIHQIHLSTYVPRIIFEMWHAWSSEPLPLHILQLLRLIMNALHITGYILYIVHIIKDQFINLIDR